MIFFRFLGTVIQDRREVILLEYLLAQQWSFGVDSPRAFCRLRSRPEDTATHRRRQPVSSELLERKGAPYEENYVHKPLAGSQNEDRRV